MGVGTERVRGTANLPMTPEGTKSVQEISQHISKIGGLDLVFHSSLPRAKKVAQLLSDATGALMIDAGDRLLPRDWGNLQGRLVSEVGDLQTYYTNQTSLKPPGGESLDQYRRRYLPMFWDIYQESRYKRIAIASHGSTVGLIYAWIIAGAKATWDICIPALRFNLPPGEVAFVDSMDIFNDLVLERVTRESRGPLSFGTLLVRHGKTAWNGNRDE